VLLTVIAVFFGDRSSMLISPVASTISVGASPTGPDRLQFVDDDPYAGLAGEMRAAARCFNSSASRRGSLPPSPAVSRGSCMSRIACD
jgi:hypothetical protein